MVFVDGILQKLTTNYTITGTTLDFGTGNAPNQLVQKLRLNILV